MKLELVVPQQQHMLGEPLMGSCRAQPLLSHLHSLDYTTGTSQLSFLFPHSWKFLWIKMDFQSLILKIR